MWFGNASTPKFSMRKAGYGEKSGKKIMTEVMANNIVASQLPEWRRNVMATARATLVPVGVVVKALV